VISPVETAVPRPLISEPGGATHLTIPPKPLNVRAKRPTFEPLWDFVTLEVKVTDEAATVAAVSRGAMFPPAMVETVVEEPFLDDLASTMYMGAEEVPCPPM
jgi:hypothetical protein